MRITLSIADDVLAAATAIGRERGATLGEVISELARKTLQQSSAKGIRNGIPLLPAGKRDKPVTLQIVNSLRDEASAAFVGGKAALHRIDAV